MKKSENYWVRQANSWIHSSEINYFKINDMKYELIEPFYYPGGFMKPGCAKTEKDWIEFMPHLNGQLEKRTDWFRPVVEPEKDYEILSYSSKIDARVFPVEESFGHEDLQIHSVKRPSDGEVFTVREDSGQGKIVAFVIKWDSMFAQVNEVGFLGIGELIKQTRQPETKRPPLGLRPKWIVAEHRRAEILEAMQRFEKDGVGVPDEWYIELGEIVGYLNSRKKEKKPEFVCPPYTGDYFISEKKGEGVVPPYGNMISGAIKSGKEILTSLVERYNKAISNSKNKQSLFTTEDGVKIYQGDTFFSFVEPTYNLRESIADANTFGYNCVNQHCFSTRGKAEEYILMNKPLLSVSVVLGIY